tara:strand:+ start:2156 stop:3058 length:903 start_codon:yes stop_codon:yes gene_type:complete
MIPGFVMALALLVCNLPPAQADHPVVNAILQTAILCYENTIGGDRERLFQAVDYCSLCKTRIEDADRGSYAPRPPALSNRDRYLLIGQYDWLSRHWMILRRHVEALPDGKQTEIVLNPGVFRTNSGITLEAATDSQNPWPSLSFSSYNTYFDLNSAQLSDESLIVLQNAVASAKNLQKHADDKVMINKIRAAAPPEDGTIQPPNAFVNLIAKAYDLDPVATPLLNVLVKGHTDRTGSDAYNMLLSQKRAETVAEALKRIGLQDVPVYVEAVGQSQPKVITPDGVPSANNRRVEIELRSSQ